MTHIPPWVRQSPEQPQVRMRQQLPSSHTLPSLGSLSGVADWGRFCVVCLPMPARRRRRRRGRRKEQPNLPRLPKASSCCLLQGGRGEACVTPPRRCPSVSTFPNSIKPDTSKHFQFSQAPRVAWSHGEDREPSNSQGWHQRSSAGKCEKVPKLPQGKRLCVVCLGEKRLVSLQKFSLSFPALFDDIPSSAAGFCLLFTLGRLEEHFFFAFSAKMRSVLEEPTAKCSRRQGKARMGTLRKGLKDGNREHFIQLEPQTGLKGSGK